MTRRCVLLLLDGIGDRSYPELGHRTPLQAARTPNLDRLAAAGASGLYHAGEVGQALPSEVAHFALFGYGPEDFPGRGALEALGTGVALGPADVAVLAHFACLREEGGTLLLERDRVDLAPQEAAALIEAVGSYEAEGVSVRFRQTGGAFGVLVLSGEVAPFVTDTNPMAEGRALSEVLPWASHAADPAACRTARALKAYLSWAHGRLRDHPVNAARRAGGKAPATGLLTQRAGRLKSVDPFPTRFGGPGLSIASGFVYWGLAAYLGLGVRKVQDSADPGRDLAERLALAREALAEWEFVHVHTKAADEAGHRKDPVGKMAAIEALDRGVGQAIGPLLDDPGVFLVVTADHCTPSSGPLIHSGETVPLLFHGAGVRRDGVDRYDEVSAARGALGLVRGRELFWLALNHTDRAKLASVMDTPVDQPFWPGAYRPFRLP